MESEKQFCLVCNSDIFFEYVQSSALKMVTSDCKLLDKGGVIMVCQNCGHIQKHIDSCWKKQVSQIYTDYSIYQLSSGKEQVIFDDSSSSALPRSLKILEKLEQQVGIAKQGSLLDVGCGNGELLRAFNKRYPKWLLAGYEQNERYRKQVMRIPGVKNFYFESLEEINLKFDLITVIHVLEHITQPSHFLEQLRRKLAPAGILFIHVPNCLYNPFDLVVFDHCSHFIPETLIQLSFNLGFEVISIATDWIENYISIVLRMSEKTYLDELPKTDLGKILHLTRVNIEWLKCLPGHVSETVPTGALGIFGTAIAGTWLASMLGERVKFFVDEDRLRVGKMHFNKKVLHPLDVPKDSLTYLAMPAKMAILVYRRLRKLYPLLKLVIPPHVSDRVDKETKNVFSET